MIRDPHPEHARARAMMDTLARAAGMPSGQHLLAHLESLQPDAMKPIGETILATVPTAEPEPKPDAKNEGKAEPRKHG